MGHNPYDLLPLWDVVDGAVIASTGAVMFGYRLRGIDAWHMSGGELLERAESLYDGLKAEFDSGTYLQFILRHHDDYEDLLAKYEKTAPRESLLRRLRDRRVSFLTESGLRRDSLYLFVGNVTGLRGQEFAQYDSTTEAWARTEATAKAAVEWLSGAGIRSARLETNELWSLLRAEIGIPADGKFEAAEGHEDLSDNARVPEVRSAREQLLTEEVAWDDDYVRVGRRYYKVLVIKDIADKTCLTQFEVFSTLEFDARVTVHLYVPPQGESQGEFQQGRKLKARWSGEQGPVANHKELKQLGDADSLSKELADTNQSLVHYGAQVVVWGDSLEELEHRAHQLKHVSKQKGFRWFEDTRAHDREVFKSLPGLGVTFNRFLVLTSNQAVDLLPLFQVCSGDLRPVLLFHGKGNRLVSYDPCTRARDNWNAAVFGAPGSGKSALVNMLIGHAMLANTETRGRMLIIDFAGPEASSYLMIARLFDGNYIPVTQDTGPAIFPSPKEARGEGDRLLASHLNRLSAITNLLLTNTEGDRDGALFTVIVERAILDTYRGRHEDDTPNYRDILQTLRGYLDSPQRDLDVSRVQTLVELLNGFLHSPNANWFLRQGAAEDSEGTFTIYDLHGIQSLPANVRDAMLYLVGSRVRDLAFDRNDPRMKYVILDELAQHIRQQAMLVLFEELMATGRKHNTAVWAITQKYFDYVKSLLADTVQTLTTTQIFLQHGAKAKAAQERIVQDWDFNPREAALFRRLKTFKGKYSDVMLRTEIEDGYGDKEARTMVTKLRLSGLDYEVVTSDRVDRDLQQKFIANNPDTPLVDVLEHVARVRRERRAA